MLKRQSPTTTCIPRYSKRARAAHSVSAHARLVANAIPSEPKRKRVTQKKKQPRTRLYGEINDRTVLTIVPTSDEDLCASDWDGIFLPPKWKPINSTHIATPISKPDGPNEIRKQEASLLKKELLSDLVVSENEIQDQIRKSIKLLFNPLISSSVTSIPPESWTLSDPARIPDGSPTREFVPPWFASNPPSPCVVQSRDASSLSNLPPSHMHHNLLRDYTDKITSELKEEDNEGEVCMDYLNKLCRGLDRNNDDGITVAEPDLVSRSGGLDSGSRNLENSGAHSPTKIRATEWWETAFFNELVAKVYKLLLVAGDEIAA
ncbi:uncharacterized protein V1513DRAFT_454041 [Lipomyces chichibuensis]|uniref:uncharacterized protein n=1 Tax=Lipomyces chichibuensis TaxID=1546026 RepID=UPI003343FA5A